MHTNIYFEFLLCGLSLYIDILYHFYYTFPISSTWNKSIYDIQKIQQQIQKLNQTLQPILAELQIAV